MTTLTPSIAECVEFSAAVGRSDAIFCTNGMRDAIAVALEAKVCEESKLVTIAAVRDEHEQIAGIAVIVRLDEIKPRVVN